MPSVSKFSGWPGVLEPHLSAFPFPYPVRRKIETPSRGVSCSAIPEVAFQSLHPSKFQLPMDPRLTELLDVLNGHALVASQVEQGVPATCRRGNVSGLKANQNDRANPRQTSIIQRLLCCLRQQPGWVTGACSRGRRTGRSGRGLPTGGWLG